MITQEEVQFIYENWKINQYLKSTYWGKNHENARPEYYLAVKRGAIFTYKENSISYRNKINNDPHFNFIEDICLAWRCFLEYEERDDYVHDIKHNLTYLKNYIITQLQLFLPFTDERIYTI